MIPHPPRSTLFPYTTLFRSYIGPENLLQMHSAAVTFTSRFSSWYKGIMSKQTRRDFLAITVASAASVPFMKSFSSAAHAPAEEQTSIEKTPGGTVAVRLTTGDQRYSPSQSLAWHNTDRASGENTIMLGAACNRQPIL